MVGRGDARALPERPLLGLGQLARVLRRLPTARAARRRHRRPGPRRSTDIDLLGSRAVGSCDDAVPRDTRRSCGRRGARRRSDPRRRRTDRHEHGGLARGSHRDIVPRGPRQAARGQPQHHQRLPGAHPRREGQLHPPDRLRPRAGHRRSHAGAQQLLRGRTRRRTTPGPQRTPRARHRDRHGEARRLALAAGPVHRRRRHPRLRRVHRRLRRAGPQGQDQQADRRRLRRRHRHPDQPRHHRHRTLGPPPHARSGRHHRCRIADLPDQLRGGRPPHHRRAGPVQGHHHLLDLRPPHHPGCRVGDAAPADPPSADGRGGLLRRGVPVDRRALRGRAVAPGLQPRRPRLVAARQADAGVDPHQHAQGPRSPHRRSGPAGRETARDAPRARPRHLRAHHLGPRPRVPHRRRRRHLRSGRRHPTPGTRRDPPHPARRVLPVGRHRVHAHPGARGEALDPGAGRGCTEQAAGGRPAPHPRPPQRGRGAREVPRHQVPGPEAVRPGGGRVAHPDPRRGARGGGRPGPRLRRARDVTPRPPERAGQHRRQVLRTALPGVRGLRRPRLDPGLGRREVPPGRGGHLRVACRLLPAGQPRGEPVAPRGRQSGGRGHGPRPDGPDPVRLLAPVPGAADPHARRRRVRGPGGRRRDAQPLAHQGLPRRRDHPRDREQPAGVHHTPGIRPQLGVLHRHRQGGAGADHPRERR